MGVEPELNFKHPPLDPVSLSIVICYAVKILLHFPHKPITYILQASFEINPGSNVVSK